jgi:hypothetical protein
MKDRIEKKFDAGELEQEKEHIRYEEKKSYQEYFKQSLATQRRMEAIGFTCAMILLGIFLRLIAGGL